MTSAAPVSALPAETVPAWLLEKTFAVRYCPNCPKPWLVRLVGFQAGCLDNKPYQRGETRDALGFGKTCEEAALAAQAAVDAARDAFHDQLARQQNWRRTVVANTRAAREQARSSTN